MNLSDLNSLDFNNAGSWPRPVKIGAVVLACLIVLGAGYWFDTQSQLQILDQTRAKEQELKQAFEAKQAKSANLEAYKEQMDQMQKSFGAMLRQLPSKAEVADLLVDISQTGLASGLEFELFSPKEEVAKEFYAELPISIRVIGSYHELGAFVSGVAALPRIVTLHDLVIWPWESKEGQASTADSQGKLFMELTAKTYRYLDEPAPAQKQEEGRKEAKK
ncbi:MAG: type 4a pilus biogenesis protein PilO [Pseudomonadota bacterium]